MLWECVLSFQDLCASLPARDLSYSWKFCKTDSMMQESTYPKSCHVKAISAGVAHWMGTAQWAAALQGSTSFLAQGVLLFSVKSRLIQAYRNVYHLAGNKHPSCTLYGCCSLSCGTKEQVRVS